MKRHTISETDVVETMATSKILLAGSYGKGANKELYWLPFTPGYVVLEHDAVVETTMFLDKAIATYNEL